MKLSYSITGQMLSSALQRSLSQKVTKRVLEAGATDGEPARSVRLGIQKTAKSANNRRHKTQ